MDIKTLLEKKILYEQVIIRNQSAIHSLEGAFELYYAHNTTAIDGNTLTLEETQEVLCNEVSVGQKALRELFELVNHEKAFQYMKNCIIKNKPLDEMLIKDIHTTLMHNIMPGGVYRREDKRIRKSIYSQPSGRDMYVQLKCFFASLPGQNERNPIELAAWTHHEFIKIHPFREGNGKIARLLMNYQLMAKGFLPVSFDKEDRPEYYQALESYITDGDLCRFTDMIALLEAERLDTYLNFM